MLSDSLPCTVSAADNGKVTGHIYLLQFLVVVEQSALMHMTRAVEAAVMAEGGRIVCFIPDNTLLVLSSTAVLENMRRMSGELPIWPACDPDRVVLLRVPSAVSRCRCPGGC